ncbi:MAG TPA: DUF6677 family protein [Thermoanaerobaculia bacterium]|nr:DUF6677 family protein [Thermoanaerobaculia bacterium]HSN87343.1 DUF6677 family protein [Thermoanaerobaculia bacterium]
MTEPGSPRTSEAVPHTAVGNPAVAVVLAWLIPGLGHVYLKRWMRGLFFLLLVLVSLAVGCALQGNLYRVLPNQPLTILATLGSMGMGLPYFFLRYFLHYEGDVVGAGYEYGTAFLLTAGLMNLLLVMDAWDIARGRKE